MRKNRLVRGTTRRAIAVASAMMLSCSMVVSNPAPLTVFAEEVAEEEMQDTAATEQEDASEEEGEASEEEKSETEGSVEESEEKDDDENEEDSDGVESEEGEPGADEEESEETESEMGEAEPKENESELEDDVFEEDAPNAGDGELEAGEPDAGEEESGEGELDAGEEESGEGELGAGEEESGEGELDNGNVETEDGELSEDVDDESLTSEEDDEAEEEESESEKTEEELTEGEILLGDDLGMNYGISLLSLDEEDFDTWYLSEDVYYEGSDGYYYYNDLIDEETGEDQRVTDRYLQIDIDDEERIIYIDEDGKWLVPGSGIRWLDGKGGIDAWRCLNRKGYVIRAQNRTEGDTCYAFDENGVYTEIESEFFIVEDEDVIIYKYAQADGTAAKVEDADKGKQHYYFIETEEGFVCYINGDTEYDQSEKAANVWLDNTYWVGADGIVVKDANAVVDGTCYYFDKDGKCEILKTQFFAVKEDGEEVIRYACEDGSAAGDDKQLYYFSDESTEVTTKYYCHTDDGELVTGIWIEWVRVNSKGRVLMNQSQIVGGKCYYFDEKGQGEWIKGRFFEKEVNEVICLVYACEDAAAAGDDGGYYYFLENEDGSRTCQYENGTAVTSVWVADFMWVNADGVLVQNADYEKISGKFYSIKDYEATMITNNFVKDDGKFYFVGKDGTIVIDQFVEYEGDTLYFGENGDQVFAEWIECEDGNRYINEDGCMLKNQTNVEIDEQLYDFDENGYATHVGYVNDGYKEEDGYFYYYIEGDKVEEEVIEFEGNLLFFGEDGKQLFDCWINDEENLYYADENGHLIVDENLVVMDDGKTYNFASNGCASLASGYVTTDGGNYYYESGIMVTGAVRADDSGNKMYFGEDGTQIFSEWIVDESGSRYADENGYLLLNVANITIDENAWSFDSDGYAKVLAGRAELNGSYYFYVDGVVQTDYLYTDSDGKLMYFGTNGAQLFSAWLGNEADGLRYADADGYLIQNKNYVELEAKTWNFDADGYASAVNGYVTIGEANYYFESGVMLTTVIKTVDEKLMYFGENGAQAFGKWVQLDGNFYYANSSGHLVTNKLKSFGNNTKYAYFYEDGVMACEEFVEYEGSYLYFGSDGWQCFAQWIEREDGLYYVDEEGHRISDMASVLLDEKYYDFDVNGIATFIGYQYEGYVTIDGIGYYYENGEKLTDTILEYENELLYFDTDGAQVVSEWIQKDGDWYRANSDGHLIVSKYRQIQGKWYYFDASGIMASDEFVSYEGNTLYFGADGDQKFAVWIARSEGDYYADEDGHVVKDAADLEIDGVYYNFDANGLAEAVVYTISYVLNGGKNSSSNPAEYTGLTQTIALKNPTRSGYTFSGWYFDSALTSQVTEIAEKSNGDITLYAKWEKIVVDDDDDDDSSSSSDSGSGSDSSSGGGSTGGDSSADITESNTISAGSGMTTAGTAATATGPAAEAAEKTAQENVSNAQAVTTATVNQNVAIQVAGTAVSATVSQTTAGSVNGNTITSAAANTTVSIAEGQVASVATTAIGADGSARSLLASSIQGATIQQTTVAVQGVAAAQNVVVYADGTQVSQQSGETELSGFHETVVTAEKAIQSGVQTVAQTYNDKVSIDLNQYSQVGAAVTYAVVAGTNGQEAKTQMEQTNFVAGQEIVALVTDMNGNVSASTIVVGANGIVQYQIPGVNCIVRFMSKNS